MRVRQFAPGRSAVVLVLVVMLGGLGPAALGGSPIPLNGVSTFADMTGHWAAAYAEWAYAEGITTGCLSDPLRFCPEQPVPRGQAAAFLWRLANEPTPALTHGFSDVIETWQQDAVSWLAGTGVTTGCDTGLFCPDRNLSRGEMAVFLWRYAGQPAPTSSHPFPDIAEAWQEDAVAWLAESGIASGFPDGTFQPARTVTRAEMATFLYRMNDQSLRERGS
ncbi:MAG: S-layer homology domain-containing protein, partial [Acidimicrobiia bacterium]|nr:S-layer homology domain-containing protein [Acidimicrobiia bacterium]